MARPCTVCSHGERQAIDKALVAGDSYRVVAGRFGLVPSSVQRHQNTHLVAAMAKAVAAAEVVAVEHGTDLASQARSGRDVALSLLADAQDILTAAKASRDLDVALDAIRTGAVALREARAHVELLGKATGELRTGTTVQVAVVQSPDWHALRDALVDALVPHEAALRDVMAVLERHGEGSGR